MYPNGGANTITDGLTKPYTRPYTRLSRPKSRAGSERSRVAGHSNDLVDFQVHRLVFMGRLP